MIAIRSVPNHIMAISQYSKLSYVFGPNVVNELLILIEKNG